MKKLLQVMALAVIPICAQAQDGSYFSSDGYPCLSGICLNDPISDHVTRVEWIAVPKEAPNPAQSQPTEWIEDTFKGIPSAKIDLLYRSQGHEIADREVLALLTSPSTVICRDISVLSIFRSESGFRTHVDIRSDESGVFRVRQMRRVYPLTSEIDINSVRAALQRAYNFPHEGYYMSSVNVSERAGKKWYSDLERNAPFNGGPGFFLKLVRNDEERPSGGSPPSRAECASKFNSVD